MLSKPEINTKYFLSQIPEKYLNPSNLKDFKGKTAAELRPRITKIILIYFYYIITYYRNLELISIIDSTELINFYFLHRRKLEITKYI